MKTCCPDTYEIMKKRKDFVRLSHVGEKIVTKSFVLQYVAKPAGGIQVGYTASKKVGGAVQRNRAKRRMRALMDEAVRLNANCALKSGYDIVLIARYSMARREFSKIQKDFLTALQELQA